MSPTTRLRWRRRLRSLAALLLIAAMAIAVWTALPDPTESVPLVHVIDGDSLKVKQGGTGVTVRLTGIDAAEYRQDCGRADASRWPCGREARAALVALAGSGPLHCSLNAHDKYGRTLGTCRTALAPDGVDIAAEMVRGGWAVATGDIYLAEEAGAQAAKRGLWQGDFARPADWRAAHARPAAAMGTVAPDR